MPDLPPPPAGRSLLSSALDLAGDATVLVSSVVVPVAVRLVGAAADAVRGSAEDLGRRLGLVPDRETVVHPWPPSASTPGEAHLAAEEELAQAQATGDVPAGGIGAADLPVQGWDELSIAAVRQRIHSLGTQDVALLLAYEREHASRPAVVLSLERRLARLADAP